MKQKEIKEMIKTGIAFDVNTLSDERIDELLKTARREVAYSTGTYGVNGLLFQDVETGRLYAVPNRSTNLFRFL